MKILGGPVDLSYAKQQALTTLAVEVRGWVVSWATSADLKLQEAGEFCAPTENEGAALPAEIRAAESASRLAALVRQKQAQMLVIQAKPQTGPLWSIPSAIVALMGLRFAVLPADWMSANLQLTRAELLRWSRVYCGESCTDAMAMALGICEASNRIQGRPQIVG